MDERAGSGWWRRGGRRVDANAAARCPQASDAAIEAMNAQFLCGRQISVTYAFKKDTKGEGGRVYRGLCVGWLCARMAAHAPQGRCSGAVLVSQGLRGRARCGCWHLPVARGRATGAG